MEYKATSGNVPSVIEDIQLNTIEEAIADIRAGKIIIVVDDEDRENEGDFICAAETATPEIINFMATHGRGLICVPLEEQRADELDLPMMVNNNTALHETAFTVSVDLLGPDVGTGISALDRAKCIQALVHPDSVSTDFARPGHIFPLRAKAGGVLRRTGHTEAAIDLSRMAGFAPAGVLVEILNADGTMARLPQLIEISQNLELKIISIKDLVAYRMEHERIVKKEISLPLQTHFGPMEVTAFKQVTNGDIHLALKVGHWQEDEPVLVRVHSVTETSEMLHTLLDDHASLVHRGLQHLAKEGKGLFLYMRHSEKDHSIIDILQQLEASQEENPQLQTIVSPSAAQRDFGIGAQILREMRISKIRLMTNHPRRRIGLIGYGLEVVEHVGF